MNLTVRTAWLASCLALLCASGCSVDQQARFARSTPWSLSGDWLVGDLHAHSRFSDGELSAAELVQRGVRAGCQVMALTDHGDLKKGVDTASPAYLDALDEQRTRYPGLVLIGGIEWNIPPYEGREHVNLLVDMPLEKAVLPAFRKKFDDVRRGDRGRSPSAEAALQWLSKALGESGKAVLIHNHPSRKAASADAAPNDLQRWRAAGSRVVGFEGGPGHQQGEPNGAYRERFQTIDRWDPLIAEPGGGWDKLLAQGIDLWAAIANSDFHNDRTDYAPCAFSRIHFQVPAHSTAGVLDALQAGSFWAEHGPILDALQFLVQAPGLEVPAAPGESISLPAGLAVSVRLAIRRSATEPASALQAELISNCADGIPRLQEPRSLPAGESNVSWQLDRMRAGADGRSCFARVRVRKPVVDNPDLLAYSNPIRIIID